MSNSNNINFVLPSIGSSEMTWQEQHALMVNQATAHIVASALEHATSIYQAGNTHHEFLYNKDEVIKLIKDVQNELNVRND